MPLPSILSWVCVSVFISGVRGILILQPRMAGEHAIIVAKKAMLRSTVQPLSARNLALYVAVWGIVSNNAPWYVWFTSHVVFAV